MRPSALLRLSAERSTGQDHRAVVDVVAALDAFRGTQLRFLRTARNAADYDLASVVDQRDAMAAWLRATVIVEF